MNASETMLLQFNLIECYLILKIQNCNFEKNKDIKKLYTYIRNILLCKDAMFNLTCSTSGQGTFSPVQVVRPFTHSS